MNRLPASFRVSCIWLALALTLTSCSKKESVQSPKPASQSSPDAAPPAAGSSSTAQPQPQAQPIASTDIDDPTPLTAKTISGTGQKRPVSYYYQFTANPGTITLRGTGKNESAASAFALVAGLLDARAERICYVNLGNQTRDKTETTNCTIDKTQPVTLRIDLDEPTIDFSVTLDGPVQLETTTAASQPQPAAGPGSTDIDHPTQLKGLRIKGDGTGSQASYFYALNAGKGDVILTADGKNRSAAVADALHVRLLNLRNEQLCDVSIGNEMLDKRRVQSCNVESRQPAILRVDLDPNTISWRAKVAGAVDFQPYTPPKQVTIALNEKVLFDFGKAVLKPEAQQTLHEAAQRMKKATSRVLIAGYTDNVGRDAVNMKLSLDRATAVRDYFVQKEAIDSSRLDVKGLGKAQPIGNNSTDEGRARNRRVEVEFSL
jgi:outer membrane protein OmpA-like peptidoglycan-associated protein